MPIGHMKIYLTWLHVPYTEVHVGDFYENDYFTSYMRVWKTADFFCLDELKALVLERLNSLVIGLAACLSRLTLKPPHQQYWEDILDASVQAAHTIYKENRDDLREVFGRPVLGLMLSCIRHFAKRESFNNLLDEEPVFAKDWTMMLTLGLASMPRFRTFVGQKCSNCGKESVKASQDSHSWGVDILKWMKHRGEPATYCRDCFPAPDLDHWEEFGT